MLTYQWELAHKAPDIFFNAFPEFPPQVLQVLYARGIRTKEKVKEWFAEPSLETLPDPMLFQDMQRAIERVREAKERGEYIVVHGDCDPDGACGAALLYELFTSLGMNVSVYLPDRETEGHAVSDKALDEVLKRKASLVVMVDVGIKEHEAVAKLQKRDIDTIILDHHLPDDPLPNALAVVDAHRKGETYPYLWLCGTGVAFVFAQAIASAFPKLIPQTLLHRLLELVAIATVSDMVPLQGANRTVLRLGLGALQRTERPGLQALFEASSLTSSSLNAHALAFDVGPRLNAASRFDHTDTAFALLTTTDKDEAEKIAKQMNRQNRLRQKELAAVTSEALAGIEENDLPPVIVMAHERWSGAVLGVAASRIVQRFHRPVFLFSLRDGFARASARSIPGFDLVRAMRECGGRDLFEDFGGHAMAAGVTLRAEWLPLFRERIAAYAKQALTEDLLVPKLHVDLEIGAHEATLELFSWLERLAPFGKGNARPKLLMRFLTVLDLQKVGKREQAVAVRLADRRTGRSVRAIARNGVLDERVRIGDVIDLVVELRPDAWKGRNGVEVNIVDIRSTNKNTNEYV